jgi:hypothetical protein
MTTWLLGLALFNAGAMAALLLPRTRRRDSAPWLLFAISLLASELAWIWLPLQATLALFFSLGGALDSVVGQAALLVLVLSWPVLGWSVLTGFSAGAAVERALQAGLGEAYRDAVPAAARGRWRETLRFRDWRKPAAFAHPDVEVIRGVPYGPVGVRQQLDIYRPRSIPPGGCPVLLQIHGGAWVIGDKAHQALPLMYHLASRGWICVAANYRLSPSVGFPVHLEDCRRITRVWIPLCRPACRSTVCTTSSPAMTSTPTLRWSSAS